MSMYLSLGAVEISAFLSFATMGFVSAKAYEYYVNYPHDRLAFKLSVAFCTLLSVLDTAFVGHWLYMWSVSSYADPTVMAIVPWELIVEVAFIGFSTLNTQCFFAWRLRKISGDYILPGIITALSVLQCAILCWVLSYFSAHRAFADLDGVFPIGYIWLGGSILGDLLITAGMGYHLLFKTRKSSLANSRMTFKKIVFRTLECNVLALVCQTGDLILFKTPSGFFFLMFDALLVKAYTFSLIFSLTSRARGETEFSNAASRSQELAGRFKSAGGTALPIGSRPGISVQVERETFTSQGEPIELDPVSVHFDRTVRPHAGSLSKEDFV